jgi:hypothetical protein
LLEIRGCVGMGLSALLFPVTRDAVNGPASIVIIQKAVERVYTCKMLR